MTRKFLLLILFLIISGCSTKKLDLAVVRIKEAVIMVEVVKTAKDQAMGLSDRLSLDDDMGMLFIYDQKEKYQFWMNKMLFPIDIIWIDDDKVIDFEENMPIPTDGNIARMSPDQPVNYVLEVNAGFVKEYGIKKGDLVEIIF